MQKHFPYSLKFIKYRKDYVSSIDVKWLNEKYFRTKHMKYLKNYKDSLENRISN